MVRVTPVPDSPKIYHITHIDNLPVIVEHGCIWSDARRLTADCDCTVVGMPEIKRRRLQEIEVGCHPGTTVGEYVPFYFCPRSIMLYILHKDNQSVRTIADLNGKTIHVRAATSYEQRLMEMKTAGLDIELVLHKNLPTEKLIRRVAEKERA